MGYELFYESNIHFAGALIYAMSITFCLTKLAEIA